MPKRKFAAITKSRRTRRARVRRKLNAAKRGGSRRLAKMAARTGDWALVEELTDELS